MIVSGDACLCILQFICFACWICSLLIDYWLDGARAILSRMSQNEKSGETPPSPEQIMLFHFPCLQVHSSRPTDRPKTPKDRYFPFTTTGSTVQAEKQRRRRYYIKTNRQAEAESTEVATSKREHKSDTDNIT